MTVATNRRWLLFAAGLISLNGGNTRNVVHAKDLGMRIVLIRISVSIVADQVPISEVKAKKIVFEGNRPRFNGADTVEECGSSDSD